MTNTQDTQPLWTEQQVRNVLGDEPSDGKVYYQNAFDLAMRIIAHYELKYQQNRVAYDDMRAENERLKAIASNYQASARDKMHKLMLIRDYLGEIELWDTTDEDADPDPVKLVEDAVARIKELQKFNGGLAMESFRFQEENERLKAQLEHLAAWSEDAMTVIERGIDLMTPDQVGQWTSVAHIQGMHVNALRGEYLREDNDD